MKKILLAIILVFIFKISFTQLIPQNNQLIINKFSILPSFAGFSGLSETFLGYKNQWIGINGAPKQANLYFSMPVGKNMGLGTSVYGEQIGNFSLFFFGFTYAYHLRISDDIYISSGISPLYSRVQFDLGRVRSMGDDPYLSNMNTLIANTYDIGISTDFYFKGLTIGFNIPRTIALQYRYSGSNYSFQTQREYFGFASYRFIKNKFLVEPAFLFYSQEFKDNVFSGFVYVKYTDFWFQTGYKSSNTLSFSLGAIAKSFIIGYNYETGISGMPQASGGSHEIYIGFLISAHKNKPYKKLATVFIPQKQGVSDVDKKLQSLEAQINAEITSRTNQDKILLQKIDSLKLCCQQQPSEQAQNQEPQWVDTVVSYAVKFGFVSDRIFASSFNELDKIALLLKDDPELKVKVIVHSNKMFGEYDKQLTQSRALSVYRYLTQKKYISPDRIYYEGAGGDRPLVPADDPEAATKNERVEFLFNKKVNF